MEPAEAVETAAVDGVVDAEHSTVQEETPEEPEEPEEPADAAPPAPPEPPKVVTRSRRRAATRPAGPPAAAAAGSAPGSAGAVLVDENAPAAGEHDHHDHHDNGPALHVPVKRRGSRKR